ncbi:MAG: DUF1874 domain-containing protein [Methanosphaera stadtmanae]|nr:DUF1874 domain-containing protein [Methanosphaera stadtmanae]
MKYIINGFSPKMLKKNCHAQIKVEPMFELELKLEKEECISAVGHYNIAEHLGVPRNRMSIQLEKGDIAYLVESQLINNQETYNYKRLTVM